MGVNYVVVPLDEEFGDFLDEMGVEYPDIGEPTMSPCPNDLLGILEHSDSLDVASGFIEGAWQASVEDVARDEGTIIHVEGSTDIFEQGTLMFEKGEPAL